MKTAISAALLASVVASHSLAKESPPPPSAPKNFQVPSPENFVLANGLAVTLVKYPEVPKVAIRLAVRAGAIDQSGNQVWLSELVGDMLLEGTTTRSASQIAETAARMGGRLEINVGADQTDIDGDVLSEFGPDMIRLIADLGRNPTFPAAELARRKADRQRQLAIAKAQPQQMALEKFRSALYPDHPYGRVFPTPAMLDRYKVEGLRAFHDASFSAVRSHLYVVGIFDTAAVKNAIHQAFDDWKGGNAPLPNPPSPRRQRSVYLVNRPGAVQSTVYVGLTVPDPSSPDYIPLVVANTMLGGSFTSRIMSNIREQKGYAYSPFSQVSSRYRDAYWVQVADVTTDVTGPSLKEIFAEIARLRREAPSADELRGFQNYLAGTFVLQNSSRGAIIRQLEFVHLHGLPEDYLNSYVPKIMAVTPGDLKRVAAKYIEDDKTTIVVVGDKKIVREQISSYGTPVE